ncbi:hypothetical protein D3C72_1548360 [compost metagenome]
MQRCHHAIHLRVDGTPLGALHTRQRLVHHYPAIEVLHQVERAANHGQVFAVQVHGGDGHITALERAHDAKLAVDGVRLGLDVPGRLHPQHVAVCTGGDQESRIGLATGKPGGSKRCLVDQPARVEQPGQRVPIAVSRIVHWTVLWLVWEIA